MKMRLKSQSGSKPETFIEEKPKKPRQEREKQEDILLLLFEKDRSGETRDTRLKVRRRGSGMMSRITKMGR